MLLSLGPFRGRSLQPQFPGLAAPKIAWHHSPDSTLIKIKSIDLIATTRYLYLLSWWSIHTKSLYQDTIIFIDVNITTSNCQHLLREQHPTGVGIELHLQKRDRRHLDSQPYLLVQLLVKNQGTVHPHCIGVSDGAIKQLLESITNTSIDWWRQPHKPAVPNIQATNGILNAIDRRRRGDTDANAESFNDSSLDLTSRQKHRDD